MQNSIIGVEETGGWNAILYFVTYIIGNYAYIMLRLMKQLAVEITEENGLYNYYSNIKEE